MSTAALLSLAALAHGLGPAPAPDPAAEPDAARSKVVFLTGDEEYRSEESMPMLAAILQRDHGVRPTVLFALADDGTIDPDAATNIPGTETLADADLLVLFTRFRALPPDQMGPILNYIQSGKPVVGFRTGTHAFLYPEGSEHRDEFGDWNEEKIAELVGQRWIVHHGHFADGERFLTEVTTAAGAGSPILRGVGTPFRAYSWLYHVEGGGDSLAAGSVPLLTGRTLRSKQLAEGRGDRYPAVQPVAWTKTNPFGPPGTEPGRVFFTTLGHPFDFRREPIRRLAVQGVLWALGKEDSIPESGVSVEFDGAYNPANSGFGAGKPGLIPAEVLANAGVEPAAVPIGE